MMRSRIASAIVGSPTMSYQLEEGYCDVMMMDFRSCLSSMMSSSMGRSLASRGTMNRSSRMSSWHRSIFLSSVSSVPLTLATFSVPSSFGALVYRHIDNCTTFITIQFGHSIQRPSLSVEPTYSVSICRYNP